MTNKLSIQSPTEYQAIKNQEPPKDVMLLVSGCMYNPVSGELMDDTEIVVLGFYSSRSNAYIRVDGNCECLSEWMLPEKYHVVYSPSGEVIEVASLAEVTIPLLDS